jgi:NADPH:quinone reductase-like Zn-dependent oxidoreductase
MKAVRIHAFGGADQLRYEEVPAPVPGAGEVLVRLAATSVNPIDWKIRHGDSGMSAGLQLPLILGRDVAGEIVAAGTSTFRIGQQVMALGAHTYAEYVVVTASALALVPEGLDIELAGALPLVVSTGAELIERVGPERGDTVLVTGALGGVGRTATYVALERGARVIVGVRARQRQEAQTLKAGQVVALDSRVEISALPELDAIADTVGGDVIGSLLPRLKRGGVVGSTLGTPEVGEGKEIRVEAFRVHPNAMRLARMAEAVRSGKLVIPIAKTFRLAEAGAAQQLAETGHVNGKVVLVP